MAELSHIELLRACLARSDEALWLEFVNRYQPVVAGVVCRVLRSLGVTSPEAAEDCVQDCFVTLFANDARCLRNFHPEFENAIFGFLSKIANSRAYDYVRHKAVRPEVELSETDAAHVKSPGQAGASYERQILMREIDEVLRSLPTRSAQRDRSIFWLVYKDGLTTKAIAALGLHGLDEDGVESVLVKTRKIVIKKLSGRDESHGGKASGAAV